MITITRKLEFDAAHRVMNHESKCATLHGHRYVVEIEATAPELDGLGRVIDFSVLKQKIGTWMDTEWDHTTIICEDDVKTLQGLHGIPAHKPVFVAPFNPTAENMANYLLRVICPILLRDTSVTVTSVTIWETPNCKATAKLNDFVQKVVGAV
jgi:6-pyruvoyltetrahydropterin/6-carboxytetrahydropterin synthase